MSTTTFERPVSSPSEDSQDFNWDKETVDRMFNAMISEGDFSNVDIDSYSPEVVRSTVGAPEGMQSTDEIIAENAERERLGDVKYTFAQNSRRALGLPLRTVDTIGIKAYGYLYDRALANHQSYQAKSAEERLAHIEKMGRWGGRVGTLGLVGVGLAAVSRFGGWDIAADLYHHTSHNIATMDLFNNQHRVVRQDVALSGSVREYVGKNPPSHDLPLDPAPSTHEGWASDINSFKYNPDLDPGRATSGKHGNDFGPSPVALPEDAKLGWPAGTYDILRNGWAKSPQEFATVLAKFKLIPNNESAINQAGEIMMKDPAKFQVAMTEVVKILSESKIEEQPITGPYGSYYAVDPNTYDTNGKLIGERKPLQIAYDSYVVPDASKYGGVQPKKLVITTKDGFVAEFSMLCKGQGMDEVKQAPVATVRYTPAPRQTQVSAPAPAPEVRPVSKVTETPPPDVTPPPTGGGDTPPPTGGGGDTPPPTPPDDSKKGRSPTPEGTTTDLGPGPQIPVSNVEDERRTQTGRDIGNGRTEDTVRDSPIARPSTQTGARDRSPGVSQGPGQKTSGASEAGSASEQSNTGEASSR